MLMNYHLQPSLSTQQAHNLQPPAWPRPNMLIIYSLQLGLSTQNAHNLQPPALMSGRAQVQTVLQLIALIGASHGKVLAAESLRC